MDAAASCSIDANFSTKRKKYGTTVATCVCCSMISESQTRYGVRGDCHGRSCRPCASYQCKSRSAKESARGISEIRGQQSIDKRSSFELAQIVRAFAEADETNRQSEFLGEREHHAAFGRAVELGDDQSRHADRRAELADLTDRVLPRGSIEHEQGFVRRFWIQLGQHAANLRQLIHQTALRVQTAGG